MTSPSTQHPQRPKHRPASRRRRRRRHGPRSQRRLRSQRDRPGRRPGTGRMCPDLRRLAARGRRSPRARSAAPRPLRAEPSSRRLRRPAPRGRVVRPDVGARPRRSALWLQPLTLSTRNVRLSKRSKRHDDNDGTLRRDSGPDAGTAPPARPGRGDDRRPGRRGKCGPRDGGRVRRFVDERSGPARRADRRGPGGQ